MPAHQVSFTVPQRRLGKEDILFRVQSGDTPLGVLAISQGAVVWFARGKKDGYKLNWRQFDEVMKHNARRAERR